MNYYEFVIKTDCLNGVIALYIVVFIQIDLLKHFVNITES